MPRALAGQVAAVTGGARGIGRATAHALTRAGLRVAIGDVDPELAQRTAAEIGSGTLAFPLDVTERASFERFLRDTESRLGPLEVLVNNAGIMPIAPFLAEDEEAERRLIDINVHGVMIGMKLALPGMVARGRGHVVNIASTAARVGVAGVATYCGTKFFVYGASEGVRAELRGTGVEISCVMPGVVKTELASGLHEPPRFIKAVEPEEVGEAIVAALRRPRFDVFVPRRIGASVAIGGLLPRRAREALARAAGSDSYFVDYDHADRRSYERRTGVSNGSVEDTAARR